MLTSALPGTSTNRLGKRESVALLAALMALNALGIDAMLPALPAIGSTFGLVDENQHQLVVIVYLLGFGLGQIVWGPLADRFGRKPILVAGVALYVACSIASAIAPSFAWLIAGRAAMGAAASSSRVLVTAMVRDLFEGEEMARIMSLVFMVFMVVPVLAPSLGQAILLIAPWRAIFWVLAGIAALTLAWGLMRLPETLHPDFRRALNPRDIAEAVRGVVTDRLAVGYTLTTSALFGGLAAYIASVPQMVTDVFDATDQLPLVFAAIAAPMALAAWGNSAIIGRFGLRRVSHAALLLFIAIAAAHWTVERLGTETLILFITLQGLGLMCFAFCTANFSTLAMTNMGPIAGTASSVQGLVSSIGGALIGLAIGQAFDGTVGPFLSGIVLTGLASLGFVLITERGRLFGPIDFDEKQAPPCIPH